MTTVQVTINPALLLDVDDAELESLTRQGLRVGVPPTRPPSSPPDPVTAHVHVAIDPDPLLDVGGAELESLSRQGLLVNVSDGYGVGGYGTSAYGGLVTAIPAPPRPAVRPDPAVAAVRTTINPLRLLPVDDAELESLTRQGLLAS